MIESTYVLARRKEKSSLPHRIPLLLPCCSKSKPHCERGSLESVLQTIHLWIKREGTDEKQGGQFRIETSLDGILCWRRLLGPLSFAFSLSLSICPWSSNEWAKRGGGRGKLERLISLLTLKTRKRERGSLRSRGGLIEKQRRGKISEDERTNLPRTFEPRAGGH